MSSPLDRRELRRAPGSRAHTLLLGDTAGLRTGTATWVENELDHGSKVVVKGWFGDVESEGHWLLEAGGAPSAAPAHTRGQIEFLGYPHVVARSGGTSAGLYRCQRDEILHAVAAGWRSVAMVQETTLRPLADAEEIARFVEQENGYDRLASRWPLNVLCQLSLAQERPGTVASSTAVHHRDVVAPSWTAATIGGRWCVSGELDVVDERELAAAAEGVLHARATVPLHIDLGGVEFVDTACSRALLRAVDTASPPLPVVVHRASALVRELLEFLGPPATLTFADDEDRRG